MSKIAKISSFEKGIILGGVEGEES